MDFDQFSLTYFLLHLLLKKFQRCYCVFDLLIIGVLVINCFFERLAKCGMGANGLVYRHVVLGEVVAHFVVS